MKSYGVIPYAQSFDKVEMIGDILTHYPQQIEEGQAHDFRDINDIVLDPIEGVKTAGRLTLFRSHGKLSFGKLMDESGEIQLMFHRDVTTIRMMKGDEG
ncbi:MAG: hypothetical protein H6766_01515 [Candidatus Peribacteria bacterium]|nr:MAG: hypothetical protein H6766_01515 [Candidatus Peribacteria bacterium]